MTVSSLNILITGGDGQMGLALQTHALAKDFHITACNKHELDITNPVGIAAAISTFSPDFIINAAAYTAVDKAESDSELAMLINATGAKNLAIACKKNNIPLLHYSTDYVFDGTKAAPYLETDTINPLNVYGKSKWLGEESIRNHCEKHLILRVSGVFSEHKTNFLKTILRLAKERPELNIVKDQITNVTYAGHIADVTYTLIKNFNNYGTYHYCDTPTQSFHAFATKIVDIARKDQLVMTKKIHAITTNDYPTAAKRPAYSVLDCHKILADYGIKQANSDTVISDIIRKLI